MKQLKSTSKDLRQLFDQNITVKYIAEECKFFQADTDSSSVCRFMDEKDYDVVGIEEKGIICGYVERTALREGNVGQYKIVFDPSALVSEATPLIDIFQILLRVPRVFVLFNNRISGIVTRGDLQKPPVRMWLFSLISLLEMQFLRLIREYYPIDSWRKKQLISESRIESAEEIFADRKRRNQEIDLVDCLQFGDKRVIILKTDEIRNAIGIQSKKSGERLLKEIEDLRDNLAHAQDIITGFWPRVVELAEELEIMLNSCEEIQNL